MRYAWKSGGTDISTGSSTACTTAWSRWLRGIRRCGKTYLLFNLFGDYLRSEGVDDDHIIEVALDVEENAALRDPAALFAHLRSKIANRHEQYYVFLDEVQYAISREELKNPDVPPRLYGVLNGLLRLRNVDVYVTEATRSSSRMTL